MQEEGETRKMNALKREDQRCNVSETGICANVCI